MEVSGINNRFIEQTINNAKNTAQDGTFDSKLKHALETKDESALKKVCKDFEGIFLNMMYKNMKATVMKSDLIPSEGGRDVFESMLDEKMVDEAVKGKGIGLGDMMFQQLKKGLLNKK